ncbi:26219_t:CDS:1 [Dentiscutata erythropus]|uniref:26219_t:CDS:1 n=1 Tax=Dentiscutata erythropus TaxID=1348616 RepID=A0A9N9H2H4_9GLOM|nr:26219_t:CDS:1 [Dentiscutata erythropus]
MPNSSKNGSFISKTPSSSNDSNNDSLTLDALMNTLFINTHESLVTLECYVRKIEDENKQNEKLIKQLEKQDEELKVLKTHLETQNEESKKTFLFKFRSLFY